MFGFGEKKKDEQADQGYGPGQGGDQGQGYGQAPDTGYGGGGQDTGYGGGGQDTMYGGGVGQRVGGGEKKHHHKKENYGKDGSANQDYGDNQAFGGGIQGGDQFTGQGTDMQRRAQEQTYGGDQTNLDAGGDTNFGDMGRQTQQGNFEGGMESGSGGPQASDGYGPAGNDNGMGQQAPPSDQY